MHVSWSCMLIVVSLSLLVVIWLQHWDLLQSALVLSSFYFDSVLGPGKYLRRYLRRCDNPIGYTTVVFEQQYLQFCSFGGKNTHWPNIKPQSLICSWLLIWVIVAVKRLLWLTSAFTVCLGQQHSLHCLPLCHCLFSLLHSGFLETRQLSGWIFVPCWKRSNKTDITTLRLHYKLVSTREHPQTKLLCVSAVLSLQRAPYAHTQDSESLTVAVGQHLFTAAYLGVIQCCHCYVFIYMFYLYVFTLHWSFSTTCRCCIGLQKTCSCNNVLYQLTKMGVMMETWGQFICICVWKVTASSLNLLTELKRGFKHHGETQAHFHFWHGCPVYHPARSFQKLAALDGCSADGPEWVAAIG